jgi:outer membrane protein assembly factor BamA
VTVKAAAYIFAVALSVARPWDASAQLPGQTPATPQTNFPAPTPSPPPSSVLGRWFNPATAPFIPIPEVGTDPNSGTTVGLIPTWVRTDENQDIDRIIAPDVLHNSYFGYGAHARIYAYPSADEQWSVVAGIKERVERSFVAQLQRGRLREGRWSVATSLVYDRDGTPRFFGVGNNSPYSSQTNFTDQQGSLQAQAGLNVSRAWQVQYTALTRIVDILPGTLPGIPSIQTLFPDITGLGTSKALVNRLAIVYDTRDDLTTPRNGAQWTAYAGVASRAGLLNDSLYSETGVDGRGFWSLGRDTVLAAHAALRYLPSAERLPFWALSCIGGQESEIGGAQPLRAYGAGRFCDRNSFSASAEIRQQVLSLSIAATHVDLELTPFVDVGRVFEGMSTWPVAQLHKVGGVGFRGVARPFVVGYVDIGYGNEGVAVFTGLNYPF